LFGGGAAPIKARSDFILGISIDPSGQFDIIFDHNVAAVIFS
jgi:hypothetical protein